MPNNYGQITPDDWEVGQLWAGVSCPYSYKLVVKEGASDALKFVWLDKDRFHCKVSSFLLREKYSYEHWCQENEYICTIDNGFTLDLNRHLEQLT